MNRLLILLLLWPSLLFSQVVDLSSERTISGLRVLGGGNIGYSPEYQTIYDAFPVKPPEDTSAMWNAMVEGFGTYWDSLVVFYLRGANNQFNATLNWIDPTRDATIVSESPAPDFVAYRGFSDDNGNGYLDWTWNPSTEGGGIYTHNSACVGQYILTNVSETEYDLGVRGASGHYTTLQSRNASDVLSYAINSNDFDTEPNIDSRGLWIINRVVATHKDIYHNGTLFRHASSGSQTPPDGNVYSLCYNNMGTDAGHNTKEVFCEFAGIGLSATAIDSITSVIEACADAMGVGVIAPPIAFQTQQDGSDSVFFAQLYMINGGYSINIDWGDENDTIGFTRASPGSLSHVYGSPGRYTVTITGETDKIERIDLYQQDHISMDVTSFLLPDSMVVCHWYGDSLYGIGTTLLENLPVNIEVVQLANQEIEAVLTNMLWRSGIYDFHIGGNKSITGVVTDHELPDVLGDYSVPNCDLEGDPFANGFPSSLNMAALQNNQFEVDVGTWDAFPSGFLHMQLSDTVNTNSNNFYGSVSNWQMGTSPPSDHQWVWWAPDFSFIGTLKNSTIPAYESAQKINFRNSDITGMPRGEFEWVSEFNFHGNDCNSTEVDALLVYIDNYFSGGTVPLTDCTYTLDGTGMGTPSATGLAAKTSIESKYTVASKTATIMVNL